MPVTITTRVNGLRGISDLLPLSLHVLLDESIIAADSAARHQETAILSGADASGARQKANDTGTVARKRARGITPNVPLYNTGTLSTSALWRTRKLPRGRGIGLSPPKGYSEIVRTLRRRGYRMIFDYLPPSIVSALDARIQRRLDVISRRSRG